MYCTQCCMYFLVMRRGLPPPLCCTDVVLYCVLCDRSKLATRCLQIGNCTLSEQFASLARELDVTEAKTPADIYKSHLAETGSTARNKGAEAAQVCLKSHIVSLHISVTISPSHAPLPCPLHSIRLQLFVIFRLLYVSVCGCVCVWLG